MKHFFNEPKTIVDDILGTLAHTAPMRLSAPGQGVRILIRDDWKKDRVALISGGGAGHEPAHAGFVGEGMLTAAVSGELFASPSVDAVLAAIREVTGKAGCMLIVKNYTGDRLNFGLAAERARAEGLRVEIVMVADDIALPDSVKPRGIAGTVLVHKFAGALAAEGKPLDELHREVSAFAQGVVSLGLALAGCDVPGHTGEQHGPQLGLGIHNETGAHPVNPADASAALKLVLTPLVAEAERRHGKTPWVVLLNNLGDCSTQEMGVLTHLLIHELGIERIRLLVTPSPLMTSLNMPGFSVSLAPATPAVLRTLATTTAAPAWPGVLRPHAVQHFRARVDHTDNETPREQDDATVALIRRITDALIASETELDAIDAQVGDGDAGSTFAAGARAVRRRLDARTLSTRNPGLVASEIGGILSHIMGGSGGVLMSILFTATGAALQRGAQLPEALNAGIERMRAYGGAGPGDRTMLDALIPAVDALPEGTRAAAEAARTGAEATKAMKRAGVGRSSYVPESSLAGVVDPGAEAVARAFAAAR